MKSASDRIFFSYGTVAQMGQPAYEAVKAYLDEFYTVGPPDVLYKYDPYADKLAEEAAKLLHCDPFEVTYIKNTTEGIIIAAETIPFEPGDEALVLGNEYPSNLLPWLKKRKDGVHVTVIPGTESAEAFEKLMAAIGPQTRVVSISSAQYYDGYTADIAALSETCRNNGTFLVLDAVQSIGVRNIDVSKTPVDFLICGGQKYLQAGPGIGFMYVNNATLPKLKDFKVGIRSMQQFDSDSYVLKDSAARFQDGTQNLPGIVALHAALASINTTGIENIERKNRELLAGIKDCLRRYDIPFIDHGDQQSNIVSMRISDPLALFNYLKERDVYIRAIKDVARITFIHTSKLEDIETVAKLTREWLDTHDT
jgi:selenocysteine lyase/cysteine desulfurase